MNETLCAYCQSSLQNHLYENAIFLAERLCAETPSEASRLLLANCHYASGAPARACAILGNCSAPQNRYLLALCHVKLGPHLEAQRALLGSASPSADPAGTAIVPNGAAGLYLLGTICLKVQPQPPASLPRDDTNERSRAVLYFKRALEIEDPTAYSPLVMVESKEAEERREFAESGLSERHRTVLSMRAGGASYQEIGEELGLDRGAAAARLLYHYAQKQLAKRRRTYIDSRF